MNGKMFSFKGFLGFCQAFCDIKGSFEILVLVLNPGTGFPNSLTFWHYFM